jgi:hypothetical protein
MGISYDYNLFFKGHMESRKDYNHASVCRLRHARFHVFIIFFSIVTWNLAWLSRKLSGHPSVCRLRHARFHMIIICFLKAIWNLAKITIIPVCAACDILDFMCL